MKDNGKQENRGVRVNSASHFPLVVVNCFYYERSLENDTITIFDKTKKIIFNLLLLI